MNSRLQWYLHTLLFRLQLRLGNTVHKEMMINDDDTSIINVSSTTSYPISALKMCTVYTMLCPITFRIKQILLNVIFQFYKEKFVLFTNVTKFSKFGWLSAVHTRRKGVNYFVILKYV